MVGDERAARARHEGYLSPWAVQAPFVKGYAGERKLTGLLDGTIDDYRDNYSCGYALFAFLETWEIDGKKVFARPLRAYMRHARRPRPRRADLDLLELRVRGPSLTVVLDGRPVFFYTTPDLAPIEGYVGCAMSRGAVRLQEPTLQRLDRGNVAGRDAGPVGLDLTAKAVRTLGEVVGRPVRGIPAAPAGTIVLWLPAEEGPAYAGQSLTLALDRVRALLDDPLHYPQKWVIAAPATWTVDRQRAARGQVARQAPARFTWVAHALPKPFTARPWVLFVDARGVLRLARRLDRKRGLPFGIERWARVYRSD